MDQLLEGANTLHQAVADLPFTTDRIAATSVWPTTIKQLRAGDIQITVLGVGLVDCKSYQMRIGGRVFNPHSAIGNRLEFALPNSLFSHSSPTEKIVSGTLILNPRYLFSGKIEVPVGFKALPNKIASFELSPSLSVIDREYSETYSVGFVKLIGKDGRRKHQQKPSIEGWKIDTSSITFAKLGGEKSSPMRLEGLPTELGFVIYSDMGKIERLGRSSKPGWATFKYSWREFKEVPNVVAGKPIVGALTLEQSAVSFRLNQNVQTISGTIKDYTGKNFVITPGRSSYGWVRVEHIKENNTLQISTDL